MKSSNSICYLLLLIFFISCSNSVKTISESNWKVYGLGFLNANLSLDEKPSSDFVNNPFDDEKNKFRTLDSLFNKNNFKYHLNDTAIIVPYEETVNGQKVCCKYDTINYMIDTLDNKTILFLYNYGLMLVNEKKLDLSLTKRPEIIIPSWNIKVGEFLNESDIFDSLEVDYFQYLNKTHTSYSQLLRSNKDVDLKSIQFEGDKKRLITEISSKVYKSEVDSFIDYFRKKYPQMPIKIEYDENKNPTFQFSKYGYYFYIFNSSSAKEYEKNYHLFISDNLNTIKNIYQNRSKKYRVFDNYYLYK